MFTLGQLHHLSIISSYLNNKTQTTFFSFPQDFSPEHVLSLPTHLCLHATDKKGAKPFLWVFQDTEMFTS